MTRTGLAIAALLATHPAIASEFLERVEMEPRTVDGVTARELTERARVCITQTITNDAVALKDTSRVNPMASIGTMTSGDSKTLDGGQVLQTVDLDGGLITAQSRTSVPFMMFNRYNVQSTVTFEARDGRFRITHTGIKAAMQDSGYASNDGFQPVRIQTGSAFKKIEAALHAISAKVSDCVATAPGSADW